MRFLIAMIAFFAFAPAAMAQSLGVKFDEMPVGTVLHYKDYEGDEWTDEYTGKKGKYHVLRRKYKGENSTLKVYYTLNGHLKKRTYRGGWSATYTPHHCEQVLGACQYRYRGNRKYDGIYNTTLTKQGGAYSFKRASASSEETFDYVNKFGQYNLLVEETWNSSVGKKRWRRLIKVETP